MGSAWRWFASKLWWSSPILVAAIGFALPEFRYSINETGLRVLIEERNALVLVIANVVSIILLVIWLIVEFVQISNLGVPVRRLRKNSAVSIFVAFSFTALGFYLIALNSLPWALLVPWIGSTVDAFLTADRAINNAAQKPLIEGERSGEGRMKA